MHTWLLDMLKNARNIYTHACRMDRWILSIHEMKLYILCKVFVSFAEICDVHTEIFKYFLVATLVI